MAVAGVGVDMVEIDRMRAVIMRTPRFVQRVFTDAERAYCSARTDPAASYAGCFAAREAVLKALGVGLGNGIGYQDVSVDHDASGRPVAVLSGAAARIAVEQSVTAVYLSISHTRDVAVANAVVLTADAVPAQSETTDEEALVAARFKEARSLLDELDPKGSDA